MADINACCKSFFLSSRANNNNVKAIGSSNCTLGFSCVHRYANGKD
jgi:hypothetical protein